MIVISYYYLLYELKCFIEISTTEKNRISTREDLWYFRVFEITVSHLFVALTREVSSLLLQARSILLIQEIPVFSTYLIVELIFENSQFCFKIQSFSTC